MNDKYDELDELDESKELKFQILEWNEFNIEDSIIDTNAEGGKDDEKLLNKYGLRLFGRTETNQSICCVVTDFTPYFFIKLDNGLSNCVKTIIDNVIT